MATPQNRSQTSLHVPDTLQPVYANLVRIAHSPADLVLDFAHLLPGENNASVGARILMSPLSAKLLLRALHENLNRYEATFGEIIIPTSNLADQLFRPFPPPDEQPPDEEDS